jgi:hypothetical protein
MGAGFGFADGAPAECLGGGVALALAWPASFGTAVSATARFALEEPDGALNDAVGDAESAGVADTEAVGIVEAALEGPVGDAEAALGGGGVGGVRSADGVSIGPTDDSPRNAPSSLSRSR